MTSWEIDEYLRILGAKGSLGRLHRSILRAGATSARDLLVAMASDRRVSWPELRTLALDRAGAVLSDGEAALLKAFEPRELLKVARVVALQNMAPSDRRVAFSLYRMALEVFGPRCFIKPHAKLFGDLAIYFGDYATAELVAQSLRLDTIESLSLRTDLANPFARQQETQREWLTLLNEQFCSNDTLELRLDPNEDDGRSPFDRLSTALPSPIDGGEKVTVAMTTWHPNEGFPTAFQSISRQSWRNLEILVLDDCSPSEFLPLLERVVQTDPRARLIRMPENRGTYNARNRALGEATGDYFTVHDSDDWAHPQRIERQVRALQSDRSLISTGSRALRADDRLLFNLPGVAASRENASSLMFRREEVISAIGYYDASRKGADTEYAVRILAHFGPDAHRLLEEHLAFIRLSPGSLSREEFKPGWRHPSRLTYRLGYQWAHSRRKAAARPLYVPRDGEGLAFQRPLRFLTNPASDEAQRRRRWDVVYVFDARGTARRPVGVLDEMMELRKHGASVAVLHLESLLYPLVAEVDVYQSEVLDAIGRGLIGEVIGTDDVSVEHIVVRDPSVLQFAHPQRLAINAAKVLLVPDSDTSGLAVRRGYTVGAVEDHAFQLFGREPTWIVPGRAEPPGVRRREVRAWGEIRSEMRWRAPRPHLPGRALRIGRVLPPGGLDLSDDAWSQVFSAGPVARATLLQPAGTRVSAQGGFIPDGIRTRVIQALKPGHLASLDVYPLHGGDPNDPVEYAHAWAAAASGCVVVWDEAWADQLGTGAGCRPAREISSVYRDVVSGADFVNEWNSIATHRLKPFCGIEKMVDQILPASSRAMTRN